MINQNCNYNFHNSCHNSCHNSYRGNCPNCCNPCRDNCSVERLECLANEYQEVEEIVANDFTTALEKLTEALNYFEDGTEKSNCGDEIRYKIIRWFKECYNGCNWCMCENLGQNINRLIAIIEKLNCESFELTKKAAQKQAEARKYDAQLEDLKNKFVKCCFPKVHSGCDVNKQFNDK